MIDLIPYIYLVTGLILLSVAADYLISGAVDLAQLLKVSPLVIGLTVIAFGTSLPELVVCVRAALNGAAGIAVGNVVGSNIANILLIIGTGALIFPISVNRNYFVRDSMIVLAASLIFVGLALSGSFGRVSGTILFACIIAYLFFSYWQGRKHSASDRKTIELKELDARKPESPARACLCVFGGLIGVAVGAELLINGATTVARNLGVSDEVIGLTMVALGTSLPELATVVAAAAKKHTDVIVGNVLGSNIFNIFGVMGATAIFADVPVSSQILSFDVWVMLAVTILLIPVMLSGNSLSRREGGIFVTLYSLYIFIQYLGVENLI
ncbi:MAG: calcium/sodium antiporter [Rhodospirillaceae bacterium]